MNILEIYLENTWYITHFIFLYGTSGVLVWIEKDGGDPDRKENTVKNLDPADPATKNQIKASITDAIAKEVVGSDRARIAQRVDKEYERLLNGAVIFKHIPSLTAGLVRREAIADSVFRDV